MQSTEPAVTANEVPSDDLGPLAWVLDELKKSLDSATKAMRRFVRDADLARGSDLASLDASHLRIARQQLHQAVGALEMVGFSAPAKVMRAMEALAQKFVQHPEQCSDDAANKMERASFALTEYLEGMLKGKAGSPVALFVQYRDVIEMVEGERVHPADLWAHDLRWIDVPIPVTVQPLAYAPPVRAILDQSVLKVVKFADSASAKRLRDISLGLAAGQSRLASRSFWQICAGFFEANAIGLCSTDVYAKRAGSRVLQQYATLAKGEESVSDRLAQDLLFFCAQSCPAQESDAPILWAVRRAFAISQSSAVNYDTAQYGRFDPALLTLVRKRISSATETWSALAGGDTNRMKAAQEQFSAVAETMLKLHPENAELARAMVRAVDSTVRSGEPPSTPVAMEVATAVLYLEATYEDLDPADTTMASRSQRLSNRLDQVSKGGASEPLESWMEELYRRVSDQQTMGSVVDELRMNLGEVEKSLDQFFRNPADKIPLHQVPGQLAQMRGVFSVLGLDQASLAMLRLRDSVEKMLVEEAVPGSPSFEKLGSSLGAVGFLIDMLSYQRTLAKKVFAWDEELGEFKPLMGRQATPVRVVPPEPIAPANTITTIPNEPGQDAPSSTVTIAAAPPNLQAATATSLAALNLPSLDLNPPSGSYTVTAVPTTTSPLPIEPSQVAGKVDTPGVMAVSTPSSLAPAAPVSPADDEEAEIRDIFLEEANEVVQNGTLAIAALEADPSNLADQTTLRRAFHTLKGSSRMVGLNDFGEAAWSMEQLMNAWLAEQKPASLELLSLVGKAMQGFGLWIGQIANRADSSWSPRNFRLTADALRLENKLIPLEFPNEPTKTVPVTAVLTPSLPIVATHELPTPNIELDTEIFSGASRDFEPTAIRDFPPSKTPLPTDPVDDDLGLSGFDFDTVDATIKPPETPTFHPEFAPTGIFSSEVEAASVAAESTFTASSDAHGLVEMTNPSHASADAAAAGHIDVFSDGSPAAMVEDALVEESVKRIGSLRISLPLYNVYLNEADEWSRRLQMDLSEWALELHKPLPDTAVAFAHSLSGSSSTVGFGALAEIARLLEAAMQHVQLHGKGRADYAETFGLAAEEIRRLLHQFAAGFLKIPAAEVMEALAAITELEFAPSIRGELYEQEFSNTDAEPQVSVFPEDGADPVALFEPSEVDLPSSFGFEKVSDSAVLRPFEVSAAAVLVEPAAPRSAEAEIVPAVTLGAAIAVAAGLTVVSNATTVEAGITLTSTPPESIQLATVEAAPADPVAARVLPSATLNIARPAWQIEVQDDDFDLADSLDADLFPIFEEEALELLPQLGGALRQWSARPDNLGARGEALRVLHTLKGSARLAGALRLGEKSHRMETSIEQLGKENLTESQIDPLLANFDDIQASFESLRHGNVEVFERPEGDLVSATGSELAPADIGDFKVNTAETRTGLIPTAAQLPSARMLAPPRQTNNQSLRVRAQVMDRLVNQAGEVMISRSRIEARLGQLRASMTDLTGNLERMRHHLRDIEVQAETQMQSRMALAKETSQVFDPLEFDQFTRLQELTRMMAESVNDVATVQRNIQQAVEGSEDDLIAQGRQARGLQRDLLRTRMVEFESISERLYGVVRQAAKDAGKQVKLDITGGSLDVDRSVLERMAPAFEHLLRNSVAHGIEASDLRLQAGKPAVGTISIDLQHSSNELSVTFVDDGAGLDLQRIRDKAASSGVVPNPYELSEAEVANLIFLPGFSTAATVSEIAGRGIGMDVVRSEMNALGGRIETRTQAGKGTQFQLVLPLTTAVTQVVMLRMGDLSIGVPANVIEIVRRVPVAELEAAYQSGSFQQAGESVAFYWGGALLQASVSSAEMTAKHLPVAIFRSAGLRVALHVDEVLGNQEVVVKNLGPQLSRLPGLTGMSVLASGLAVLIYNPVALVSVYGDTARAMRRSEGTANIAGALDPAKTALPPMMMGGSLIPLIMVVDDSITVRRVTQRLLKREGYRVVLAADGLQALERLQDERPTVVLSDIEMPRMDGFDLARNIRADAALKSLPIIMITSRIAEKHREHARELGVDHYLGKPYSEDELLRLVHQYVSAEAAAKQSH